MGGYGIHPGNSGQVRDVIAESNGSIGVRVGDEAVVTRVTANLNDDSGIVTGDTSVVVDATASQNDVAGIGAKGVVRRCTASDNGENGFAFSHGVIVDSVAVDNGGNGFEIGSNATVRGCLSMTNGQWGYHTPQTGVSPYRPGTWSSASYQNASGHFDPGFTDLGANVCDGSNTSCP